MVPPHAHSGWHENNIILIGRLVGVELMVSLGYRHNSVLALYLLTPFVLCARAVTLPHMHVQAG